MARRGRKAEETAASSCSREAPGAQVSRSRTAFVSGGQCEFASGRGAEKAALWRPVRRHPADVFEISPLRSTRHGVARTLNLSSNGAAPSPKPAGGDSPGKARSMVGRVAPSSAAASSKVPAPSTGATGSRAAGKTPTGPSANDPQSHTHPQVLQKQDGSPNIRPYGRGSVSKRRNVLIAQIRAMLSGLDSMFFFHSTLDDDVVSVLTELLRVISEWRPRALASDPSPSHDHGATWLDVTAQRMQERLHSSLTELISTYIHIYFEKVASRSWRSYVLECVLTNENAFSRDCRAQLSPGALQSIREGDGSLSDYLEVEMLGAARYDLERLGPLLDCNAATVCAWVEDLTGWTIPWDKEALLICEGDQTKPHQARNVSLSPLRARADQLVDDVFPKGACLAGSLTRLAGFHSMHGAVATHFRFLYDERSLVPEGAGFGPAVDTDLLIGMEKQVHTLRQNLTFLMHDLPTQNVLMRGPRSSAKRALLHAVVNDVNNRDGGSRLKVIDLAGLCELSALEADVLRSHRNCARSAIKYVVFVEELDLEDAPAQVANCRAILDSCASVRNPNWIFIATSTDQVDAKTLALAGVDEAPDTDMFEMFGLHLVFEEPSRERFLEWTVRLCEKKRVDIAKDIIILRAAQYARECRSYSFRTANNFATYLESEQKFLSMSAGDLWPQEKKKAPQVLDWKRLVQGDENSKE
ncbi:hypothetical protein FVE85_4650 [Porphyridium purpureum]|uniref:Uncharacterized protein n=1 Tax=Porphyridium purpureum TaxID=35688 RepID=A0A5J4YRU7_PORPP|nr:hypothetical protein FVE85_4650 [Porphyridium purpureum]|eukprot:POR1368..scf236_6